jgi:hypothetical protein
MQGKTRATWSMQNRMTRFGVLRGGHAKKSEGPDDPDYYGEDGMAKALMIELQQLAVQAGELAST